MKKFGLIGYPLGHSLSPKIHRALFDICGENASYELAPIKPGELDVSFDEMKRYDGFNVTIPHKIEIIPFLDKLDSRADLFGAVNTVKVENGCTIGHNTDCMGFLRSLKSAQIPLSGEVLVCGSGGVSRMFAFESVLSGASVTIAARNKNKADLICSEIMQKTGRMALSKTFYQLEGAYDLIINGTNVGMFPKVNECVLDDKIIKKSSAVFDAIYNPSETLLIKKARESNIKCLNGLPMLVWQAAIAQEIWNGVNFSDDQVNGVIEEMKKESL